MKRVLVGFMLLLMCSCATPYQPCGLTGGYYETQLDANVYRVSFRGNGVTSPERAADLCLLRSAMLAKQHGFSYFIIIDNNSYTNQSMVTLPTTATTTANINTFGTAHFYGNKINTNTNSYGTSNTVVSGGATNVVSRPTSCNTIMCFKERPQTAVLIYDANFLTKRLSQQYHVPHGLPPVE